MNPFIKMHQIYGSSRIHKCKHCCNFQKKTKGETGYICIAYGENTLWNEESNACESLYNVAFNGMRPRLYTIEEAFPEKRRDNKYIEGQESFLTSEE